MRVFLYQNKNIGEWKQKATKIIRKVVVEMRVFEKLMQNFSVFSGRGKIVAGLGGAVLRLRSLAVAWHARPFSIWIWFFAGAGSTEGKCNGSWS